MTQVSLYFIQYLDSTLPVLHPGTVNVLNPTEMIKNITANVALQPI